MKKVLITTAHKGVFYGEFPADADLTTKTLTNIQNARMAIYWGTEKGVMQLAQTGPTSDSIISAKCDIPVLHDVTAVFAVTEQAAEVWSRY